MMRYRHNYTIRWIAVCGLACLVVLPMRAAHAADKPAGPPPEAMERVKSLSDHLHSTISEFVEGLARGYVGAIIRTDQAFDAEKITKPEHRFFLFENASKDFIDTTLAQYDAFAVQLRKDWAATPAPFRVGVRNLLAGERDRLELFLREDPAIIRSVIKPMLDKGTFQFISTATIMTESRVAGEKADAGPGFTNRLRRAARVGDAELRRVMTQKARKTATDLTDQIADNYVKFLIAANQVLDKNNVRDTVARAYSMAEQNRNVITAMLAEYDRFAAAMTASFKGSGKIIEPAVAVALAAERARIASFLNTDPEDLRTAYTRSKGKFLAGAELRRQLELAAEIEAEEKVGVKRFK